MIKTEKLMEEAETEMARKARSEVERKIEIVSVITEVVDTGIIAENAVTEESAVVEMMMTTAVAAIVTMIGECS